MNTVEMSTTTQYLTFQLQDEVFALDIAKVREVLDFTKITKVPRMPDFMCGVINLRGSVVPVVDLRLKLGMTTSDKTGSSCIIIMEVAADDGAVVLGALVDSVREVLDLASDHIEPPPKIGTKLRNEFIRGMGKQDDRFIIVLEIDKVFASDDASTAQHVSIDMSMPDPPTDAAA